MGLVCADLGRTSTCMLLPRTLNRCSCLPLLDATPPVAGNALLLLLVTPVEEEDDVIPNGSCTGGGWEVKLC